MDLPGDPGTQCPLSPAACPQHRGRAARRGTKPWGPRVPQSPPCLCGCETPAWEGTSVAIPLRRAQHLGASQGCRTSGAASQSRAQADTCTPFPSAEPPGSLTRSLCSRFPTCPPTSARPVLSCPLPSAFPFLPRPRGSSSLPGRSDDKFPTVALQTVINNALLLGAGSFH